MQDHPVILRKKFAQKETPAPKQPIVVKVEIPCSALVKHYMEKNFGHGKNRHIRIDRTSTVGKYFYKCIENPSGKHDGDFKGYPQTIVVEFSESVFLRQGCVMRPSDLVEFNRFVTKLIYQAVWLYIEARQEGAIHHTTAKKLMDEFCIKFGYPEEILSYERLKKAYQYTTNSDKGLNIC